MMLFTRNTSHQKCLGSHSRVRRPSHRPPRSMLLLAGLRQTPCMVAALVPALSAASGTFAGWQRLRSSRRGTTGSGLLHLQQQQQQGRSRQRSSSCFCIHCESSGSRSNNSQDVSSMQAAAARWQLIQMTESSTSHGLLLPAAARMLEVAAAAAAPGGANAFVVAAADAGSSSRRSRSSRAAAAEAAVAVAPPEPAAGATTAANGKPKSSRREKAGSAAAAGADDERAPAAEAAAVPVEAAAGTSSRRRRTKASTSPAAAAVREQQAPAPAAAPAAIAGPAAPKISRRNKPSAAAVEAEAAALATPRTSRRARSAVAAPAAAEPAAVAVLETLQQARELLDLLNEYAAAYYNGEAQLPDDVYDSELERFKGLLRQLRVAGAAAEAQDLEDNSPLRRVGAPVPAISQLQKVQHPTPMTSLASMRNKDELVRWGSKLALVDPEAVSWVVEPKVDGLALRAVYRSGKLSLAATRGDGSEGEDITHNLLTGACQGLPVNLKARSGMQLPSEFEVRGELYMKTADFDALNAEECQLGRDGFANTRNVASGSARLLDPQEFARRRLSFMAYQLLLPEGTPHAPETQSGSLDWLKAVGISTTTSSSGSEQIATYDGFTAAVKAAEKWMEKRDKLDYEVDGAVLKINDLAVQESLGVDGARDPKWAVAWKFPAQEVTTILRGIEWSVGRHGAVTPVALLEPVWVAGINASRATLHNVGMLRSLGLRIGDTVTVKRAGDVIPQLLSYLPEARSPRSVPIEVPKKCPSCTNDLKERQAVSRNAGDQLFCENQSCPAQQLGRLQAFVSACMDGIGDATIEELWNRGLLHSPAGFYKLTKEDLLQLPATKDKKATKYLNAIEKSKNVPLAQLIQGLGIPCVGKQQAENLAKKYKSMKALQLWSSRNNGNGHDGSAASHHRATTTSSSSSSSEGGEKGVLGDSLATWFTDAHNKLLLNELRDLGVKAVQEDESAAEQAELQLESNVQDPRVAPRIGGLTPGRADVDPLGGLSICVTGTLTSTRYGHSRESAKSFIEARGGEFHEKLKRGTNWLVVADKPGKGKIAQAQKWGTRILTEHELNAEIEQRVLQLQGYIDFPLDPPTQEDQLPLA